MYAFIYTFRLLVYCSVGSEVNLTMLLSAIKSCIFLGTLVPVSYTHLDVYKRQIPHHTRYYGTVIMLWRYLLAMSQHGLTQIVALFLTIHHI